MPATASGELPEIRHQTWHGIPGNADLPIDSKRYLDFSLGLVRRAIRRRDHQNFAGRLLISRFGRSLSVDNVVGLHQRNGGSFSYSLKTYPLQAHRNRINLVV